MKLKTSRQQISKHLRHLIFVMAIGTLSSAVSAESSNDNLVLSNEGMAFQISDKSTLFEFASKNTTFDFFSFSENSLSGYKNGNWHLLGPATLSGGSVKISNEGISLGLPSDLKPIIFSWTQEQAARFFKATEIKTLSESHRDALTLFAQGRMDRPINLILRGSSKVDLLDQSVQLQARNLITLLDDSFVYATPLPMGLILYRGISNRDIYGSFKVGNTFTDNGFISTSTSKNVALRFANLATRKTDQDANMVQMLIIRVNSELVQGHYMPLAVGSTFDASESEVLIKKGQTFRVLQIEEATAADGRLFRTITVETVSK